MSFDPGPQPAVHGLTTLKCPRCAELITEVPQAVEMPGQAPEDATLALAMMREYAQGIEDMLKHLIRLHFQTEHTPRPFWVSWWHDPNAHGPFEMTWPWWITGYNCDGQEAVMAAVKEENDHYARDLVTRRYASRPDLRWRFVEERPEDWTPFVGRFRRAEWMQWEDSLHDLFR